MGGMPFGLKVLAVALLATGFVAGKIDLDQRINELLADNRRRIVRENADIIADQFEKRQLGKPVG
jgi:hypothetical protein